MKQVKIFLAIYFPIFILCGILYHKGIVGPWVAYVLSAITIAAIGWVVYQIKFKKR